MDVDRRIEELNLTCQQWDELEAYDELCGLGYSRRDDARWKLYILRILQAQGATIEDGMLDYMPTMNDPDTSPLDRVM